MQTELVMRPLPAICLFLCALNLSACADMDAGPVDSAKTNATPLAAKPVAPSQDLAIRDALEQQSPAKPVTAFYLARAFAPAWMGDPEKQDAARAARALLARAGEQGLRTEDYALEEDCDAAAAIGSAQCDIALTAAVLRYAQDVQTGREA